MIEVKMLKEHAFCTHCDTHSSIGVIQIITDEKIEYSWISLCAECCAKLAIELVKSLGGMDEKS